MIPYSYCSQEIPERIVGPVRHEAILAYRAWSIRKFSEYSYSTPIEAEDCWFLHSCSITGNHWMPGENQAKHSGSPPSTEIPPNHEAPLWECLCGYWAVERLDNVFTTLHRSGLSASAHVYGSVYLWGKIIRHEEGYRAAMAQVAGLLLPENENHWEALYQIAERYQVPLVADKKYLGG